MKKLLKRAAITVGVLLLLLNILLISQAYYFTHYFPLPQGEQPPSKASLTSLLLGKKAYKKPITQFLKIPYTTVQITTADGEQLQAWHAIQNARAATVILFHGHSSNKGAIVPEAQQFYKLGYNLLLVDFRAHGASSGNNCSIGYFETRDVAAAYRYIEQQTAEPIILWGISLGAATIIKTVADSSLHPSHVIAEMPFASLHQAVKGFLRNQHLPQEPLATLLCLWGGAWQGFNAFNHQPFKSATKLTMPVLVQWGQQDPRVSEAETNTIFEHIASQQKKLKVYPMAGHVSLWKNDSTTWKTTIQQFLKK
ncbi:MAG: hypothetical protein EAZ47_00780 [Bacteroidetes bacterium]|nr:MAG: hypothetical protein EAY72_10760 [Bacteroidota bacterium]TAE61977.1 MAG: hypothetical protein EAY68_09555 [Bacteroidota bacterium]TAF98255.1 MAG: hypothetical protein EAZ47_00780 [Bacteroidota bacterium]